MNNSVLITQSGKANQNPLRQRKAKELGSVFVSHVDLALTSRQKSQVPSDSGLMHHELQGWEVSKQGKAKLLGLMPLPVYFCRRCYLPGHLPGVLSHGFEQP